MKVLVIGGGGREHAIAWRIAKSTKVTNIFVAPGNAGTINHGKILNVDLGENYNIKGLSKFAKDENIDLTIVGPEKFLVEGIVDFPLAFNPAGENSGPGCQKPTSDLKAR